MKIIFIGNNNLSNKLEKKLQENNIDVKIFEDSNLFEIKNYISNINVDYIFNLSHKKNNNYFSKNFKESEIIFNNLKLDIEIAEICIDKNIKLIHFENKNREEDIFISNMYKIYSKENNLKVNIIKIGDILENEINTNLNTVQYVSKFIINTENESIKYENINKSFYFNIESELNIVRDFNLFRENYNVIDYTREKISLVDVIQNVIQLSKKNIKILDNQNNVIENYKEITFLKDYLEKTFYDLEIDNQISELKDLTQGEMDKMNNILQNFDENKDGELDIEELNNVFSCMGFNLNFKSLIEIFKRSDKNKDGKINKKEFILLMKENIFSKNKENEDEEYSNPSYSELKIEG